MLDVSRSTETSDAPVPPGTPAGLSPGTSSAPGTSFSAGSRTLSWNSVSGATSYRLYVTRSTSSSFSSIDRVHNGTTVNGTSFSLSLQAGYFYRWTVAAYNSTGEGGAPSNRFFHVPAAVTLPPAPSNPSPGTSSAPGTSFSAGSRTLSWNSVSGATSYRLYVTRSTSSSFSSIDRVHNGTTVNGTSFSLSLQAGYFYRWQVASFNSAGESAQGSTLLHFHVPSVITRPDEPGGLSPGQSSAPGTSVSAGSVQLRWNSVSNATLGYKVTVTQASNQAFSDASPLVNDVSTSGTSYSITAVAGRYYRWNVVAVNSAGESAVPARQYFFVPPAVVIPPPPTNLSPGSTSPGGPSYSAGARVLSWNPVSAATSYKVYLSSSSTASGLQNASTRTTTSFTTANTSYTVTLSAGLYYRWEVASVNSAGDESTARSALLYFYVPSAVVTPTVTSVESATGASTIPGLDERQWITLRGTNFAAGVVITLRDKRTNEPIPDVPQDRTDRQSSTLVRVFANVTNNTAQWTAQATNPGGTPSVERSFQVQATTLAKPPEPTNLTPGATTVSAAPTVAAGAVVLRWNAVPEATQGYRVTVRRTQRADFDFATSVPVVSDAPVASGTSYTLTAEAGWNYRWTVVAVNAAGESSAPTARLFTVPGVVSGRPVLSSVSPNPATGSADYTTLELEGTGFASGVQVILRDKRTDEPAFLIPAVRTTFVSARKVRVGARLTANNANWTAQVRNPDGATSEEVAFRVEATTALGKPGPLSPGSDASPGPLVTATTQTFRWSSATGATSGYVLYLRNINTDALTEHPSSGLSVDVPNLTPGHSYRWQVGARAGGAEQLSALYYFRVQAANATPRPDYVVEGLTVSPGSGGADASVMVRFRIKNNGAATTTTTVARLKLSPTANPGPNSADWPKSALWAEKTIPALGANQSSSEQTITFVVPTASVLIPRAYNVWITADANGAITNQSDVTNDWGKQPFTITGATPPSGTIAAHGLNYPMGTTTQNPENEGWTPPGPADHQGYDHGVWVKSSRPIHPGGYYHTGEDWNLGSGDDDCGRGLFAPGSGRVIYAGSDPNLGYMLVIRHQLESGDEVESVMAHLQRPPSVAIGDRVVRGQPVAKLGKTPVDAGWTCHLHFEIRNSESQYYGKAVSGHGFGGLHAVPTEANGYPRPAQVVRANFNSSTPTSPPLQPNLVVESPTVTPSTVAPGGDVRVAFTIRNAGTNVATTSAVSMSLAPEDGSDSQGLAAFLLRPLMPGESATFTGVGALVQRINQAVPGRYQLRLTVDADNRMDEGPAGDQDNVQSVLLNISEGSAPAVSTCDPAPAGSVGYRSNPCPADVAREINRLASSWQVASVAQRYRIPPPVLMALIWQESSWQQFVGGETYTNPKDGGLGLGQITGRCGENGSLRNCGSTELPNKITVERYVPDAMLPFGYRFENADIQIGPESPLDGVASANRRRVRDEWTFNLETAAGHLFSKFRIWAALKTNPRVPGLPGTQFDNNLDVDPDVIENWYYPLAWYNGGGTDAYTHVGKVYTWLRTPQNPASAHAVGLPNVGDPRRLPGFPTTIKGNVWPDGLETMSAKALMEHGFFSLRLLAMHGERIHRWDWNTKTARNITSQIKALDNGTAASISLSLEPGQNLVSLPLAYRGESTLADAILQFGLAEGGTGAEGLDASACYFTSGATLACGELDRLPASPGTGYFLRYYGEESRTQELSGFSVPDTVQLVRGLNLVGRSGSGLFQANPSVHPVAYTLDGDRTTPVSLAETEFQTGRAYYVYAQEATSLVPSSVAGVAGASHEWGTSAQGTSLQTRRIGEASTESSTDGAPLTQISTAQPALNGATLIGFMAAQEGADASTLAGVGYAAGATNGFDEMIDGLQALPMPGRPSLFVDELYGLSWSVRASGEDTYEWPLVIQESPLPPSGQPTPVILTWAMEGLPSGATAHLIDLDGRTVADLRAGNRLDLAATGTGTVWRFTVLVSLSRPVNVDDASEASEYALHGVAPNPLRNTGSLAFSIPEAARVRVTLYDVLGRRVLVALDEPRPAGHQRVEVDATALSPGVYFVRLEASGTGQSFETTRSFVRVR